VGFRVNKGWVRRGTAACLGRSLGLGAPKPDPPSPKAWTTQSTLYTIIYETYYIHATRSPARRCITRKRIRSKKLFIDHPPRKEETAKQEAEGHDAAQRSAGLDAAQRLQPVPPWRQPRGKLIVSSVNSHQIPPESSDMCGRST